MNHQRPHAPVVESQVCCEPQITALPAVHRPALQVSLPLHRSTSAQDVPSGARVKTQPKTGTHVLVVQELPSSHTKLTPDAEQTPAAQDSLPSHRSASGHGAPSATGVNWQAPVCGLHVLPVQGLLSSQPTGTPALHRPKLQVSAPLHRSASAQEVPLGATVNRQPLAGTQVFVVQELPSSHVNGVPDAEHTPVAQVSLPSHRSASGHSVPSGTGINTQVPEFGLQALLVHGLLSSQLTGVPEAEHTPFVQVSVPSHRSASGQAAPLGRLFCTQPQVGSQVVVVQGFAEAAQFRAVPCAEHCPAWHVSLPSHTSASAQGVPSSTLPGAHWPVAGTQAFTVQTLLSPSGVQTTSGPSRQAPPAQRCPSQRLPSGQGAPSAKLLKPQAPVAGLHVSVVQGLPSSQLDAAAGRHVPSVQVSTPLHRLPSEQDVPSGNVVFRQPAALSQWSLVHGSPSSQSGGAPDTQTPPEQVSLPLQRLPSSQAVPAGASPPEQTPVRGSQTSRVQGLPSSWQSTDGPALQTPCRQSWPSHRSSSWQALPSASRENVQAPEAGEQMSAVHGSPSTQCRGVPTWQKPRAHVSVPLHRSSSRQSVAVEQGRAAPLPSAPSPVSPVGPPLPEGRLALPPAELLALLPMPMPASGDMPSSR